MKTYLRMKYHDACGVNEGSFKGFCTAGNWRRAAEHILQWSQNQSCPDPAGFTEAMIAMFKVEAQIQTVDGIELDKVSSPCTTWSSLQYWNCYAHLPSGPLQVTCTQFIVS